MVASMIGLARGDLSAVDRWLADREQEGTTPSAADQRFFVLLWQRDFKRAGDFARAVSKRVTDANEVTTWLERRGDALLLAGAVTEARAAYEEVLARDANASGAILRLADVHFLLGDAAREKEYRERIYGTLLKE
jgi:predicted negative regulator of RcsB-dependent stress response